MPQNMNSINDLMTIGLTYVLDFENKVSEEAKKMSQASSDPEVKQVFEQSASKGKEYATRIEQVFQKLNVPVNKNDNNIAKAMIAEVENMIGSTSEGPVRDAALIAAANQMQLYRVAVYGSLESYAKLVGKSDAASGLTQSLEDSKGGDAKLTKIGEQNVNQKAASAAA